MNHDHSRHDFEPAVREEVDGRLVVGFMGPVAMLQLTSYPELGRVAHEGRQRLERVRSALGGSAC